MEHGMFSRIVVPLDGSETAERALAYGEELAGCYALCLHLVRVVDGADLPELGQNSEPEVLIREMLAAQCMAAEYLHHVSTELRTRGLSVSTEVRRGGAGRQVLATR